MTSKTLLLIITFSFLVGTVLVTGPLGAQQAAGPAQQVVRGGAAAGGNAGGPVLSGPAWPGNGPQQAQATPGRRSGFR